MGTAKYRYAVQKENYEDIASGNVFYRFPPAFPARLASEIFLRLHNRMSKETTDPYRVYDPFCGGGYLLGVLGILHGELIDSLFGSDINVDAVAMADKNLQLTNIAGLHKRIEELQTRYEELHRPSAKLAIVGAHRIIERIKYRKELTTKVFVHDALTAEPPAVSNVDMIIADLPYGNLSLWSDSDKQEADITTRSTYLAETFSLALAPKGIVAICVEGKIKLDMPNMERIESLKIGHRFIQIYKRK